MTGAPTRRLALTLRKPWLGWFPKPTVVVNRRGQPSQWGVGTWQIPVDDATVIGIFLFNGFWKFGAAQLVLDIHQHAALTYRAPFLPFLRGKLTVNERATSESGPAS